MSDDLSKAMAEILQQAFRDVGGWLQSVRRSIADDPNFGKVALTKRGSRR